MSEGSDEEGRIEETGKWGLDQSEDVVYVETGRGGAVPIPVGSPFRETIERLAEEAHYGGSYRVFLDGNELLEPEEAPESIEAGMRIHITTYDKVG